MAVERPPQEAVALLDRAVKKSKRRESVRLPQEFARDKISATADPPLARLLRGGGGVRIKVLLTTLMMATRPPHDTRVSSKELAEMLHLTNPEVAGSRRVNKAFADLEEIDLVRRERSPGHVPNTVVLFPGGGGEEWDDTKLEKGYITLPPELWQRGWIVALSGRAIALLIILRELTGGRSMPKGIYVEAHRKREYGLSDDTWTKGTKELREAGLLEIVEEVTMARGEPRRRNLYTLLLNNLKTYDPGNVPTDVGAESSLVVPRFD